MSEGREEGSATVLVVAAVAVVTTLLAAVLVVVATVRDVHRARAAADLAALAAGAPTAVGGAVDCRSARVVARANGAGISSCRSMADGSAVVAVSVPRGWPNGFALRLPPQVSARARAGLGPVGNDGAR